MNLRPVPTKEVLSYAAPYGLSSFYHGSCRPSSPERRARVRETEVSMRPGRLAGGAAEGSSQGVNTGRPASDASWPGAGRFYASVFSRNISSLCFGANYRDELPWNIGLFIAVQSRAFRTWFSDAVPVAFQGRFYGVSAFPWVGSGASVRASQRGFRRGFAMEFRRRVFRGPESGSRSRSIGPDGGVFVCHIVHAHACKTSFPGPVQGLGTSVRGGRFRS